MPHKVILVGASGLIGSHLLLALIESTEVSRIVLLLSKLISISNHKVQQVVINFDDLNSYSTDIQEDIIFSCLRTTNASSPNSEVYRKIDLEYPLQLAKIGLRNGISQFHVVSSLGANKSSSSLNLSLKGELESEQKKLFFTSLHIYQLSLKELKGIFTYPSIQIQELA